MHLLWIILIGFIAGVIAKLVTSGKSEPQGFILTTVLGIIGAFVVTYFGADQGARVSSVQSLGHHFTSWGYIARSRRT
jgi:uncharacterized membrane protein YeaQ/YmgE (transglycosylase-associated protein family)